jgi:hypothetical protein
VKKEKIVAMSVCIEVNGYGSVFNLKGYWKGNRVNQLIVSNYKKQIFQKRIAYVLYLVVKKYENETIFTDLIRYKLIE